VDRESVKSTADSVGRIYERRFSGANAKRKDDIWREIVRYLQRYVRHEAIVMDVACDCGHFIRHIVARERWAADVRDVSSFLPPSVRFVQSDGVSLGNHVPANYFDAIFMSNYLEHLDSGDLVIEQFRTLRRLLKPGGRVIVLQPNIRLVGDAYWDFIDHKVPLTERSLSEAAELAGFRTRTLITRFLPYTTKSRFPQHPLLVRAYLAFRPAWLFLGRQSLYVGESPKALDDTTLGDVRGRARP
jgi:ubiquinone/menaquinone biosynthesis C-methylase UbiE